MGFCFPSETHFCAISLQHTSSPQFLFLGPFYGLNGLKVSRREKVVPCISHKLLSGRGKRRQTYWNYSISCNNSIVRNYELQQVQSDYIFGFSLEHVICPGHVSSCHCSLCLLLLASCYHNSKPPQMWMRVNGFPRGTLVLTKQTAVNRRVMSFRDIKCLAFREGASSEEQKPASWI